VRCAREPEALSAARSSVRWVPVEHEVVAEMNNNNRNANNLNNNNLNNNNLNNNNANNN
jgi:hypothetical protein